MFITYNPQAPTSNVITAVMSMDEWKAIRNILENVKMDNSLMFRQELARLLSQKWLIDERVKNTPQQ